MSRKIFSAISLLSSALLCKIEMGFFTEYFVMYEDVTDGVDNACAIGLAGIAIGILFFIAHIIFVICIFTKAWSKEIKKIYLNELIINREDRLVKNIVRGITYLLIIFFIIALFKEVHNNIIFLKFYSLCIICIAIYSIWINNILRENYIAKI
ncbi:hypothetical protein [Clostridium lundense]|uniref:hypothetical protein n=1 Tax=Clostridium lundense TaxID=319475 RepID=UPI000487745B|nr:hypothetical protein [Clostridium lundense]